MSLSAGSLTPASGPAPSTVHSTLLAPLQGSNISATFSTNAPTPNTNFSSNSHSQPNNRRKRKVNQKVATKSPEQAEIDYLNLELNAVRTKVVDIETSKQDLERKIKIMEAVIKMHEERQTSQAYQSLFPGSDPPPMQDSRPTTHTGTPGRCCNASHSCPPSPPCQSMKQSCCQKSCPKFNNSSEIVKDLQTSVVKLECTINDIANNLENLASEIATTKQEGNISSQTVNTSNFDNIEIIEDSHNISNNDSIVSIDKFVPDVADNEHVKASLNC